TAESVTVSSLTPDTTYCFLLRVEDDSTNVVLSNVLSGKTRDAIAPATPSLLLGTVTSSSIQVSWAAVGDDGTSGTVLFSDLRYKSGAGCSTFGSGSFTSGTQVSGQPAPHVAGTAESITL